MQPFPTPKLLLRNPLESVSAYRRNGFTVPALRWLPTSVAAAPDEPRLRPHWEEPPSPPFVPLSNPEYDPPSPAGHSLARLDERSGWAKWNSSLWGVTATAISFEVTMLIGFTMLPSEETGWNEPKFRGMKRDLTMGPRVDNDRTYFNYVAHPIDGSEFYMMARNRGCNWWQGFAYAAAMSTFFEFVIESAYEQAAWQDLFITPVSGAALGELRWQIKKSVVDPKSGKPVGALNKFLYVFIDPIDAIYNL